MEHIVIIHDVKVNVHKNHSILNITIVSVKYMI